MPSRIIPPPPPNWNSWEDLMQVALKEALKAKEINEIPVGAVIVDDRGEIIAKAHNQSILLNDPTAHAEILAIRSASKKQNNYRLNNCHLIVSLEPCLMCTGAIVHARLAGAVFAAYDKKTGTLASCLDGFDLPFNNFKPWQLGGICEEESVKILQDFFNARRA